MHATTERTRIYLQIEGGGPLNRWFIEVLGNARGAWVRTLGRHGWDRFDRADWARLSALGYLTVPAPANALRTWDHIDLDAEMIGAIDAALLTASRRGGR